jgi:hypothetical protein
MDTRIVREKLSMLGYCLLSDAETKDIATHARAEYLASMKLCEINAPRTKMNPLDLSERPWRKLAIGSSNGLGEPYAQLLQTTYFGEFSSQYPHLRNLFSKMTKMRNEALGIIDDFGSVPSRDGFWNACRIHHYPRGGGFMMAHRDTHFPKVLETAGHPFLQLMVILSERGRDFHGGGGFIMDRNGEKIYFESLESFGDAVFFDGDIVHGVEDVDGDQVIDFASPSGRIAAFVNLYQVLG